MVFLIVMGKIILFLLTYQSMCLYLQCVAHGGQRKGSDPSEAGDTGSCKHLMWVLETELPLEDPPAC